MEDITIRKATFEDAAEIANVHINSWKEAYKGLIHQNYLDDRPLHFKNRYELWKKVTVNEKQITLVAESKEHGVVVALLMELSDEMKSIKILLKFGVYIY